MLKKSKSKDAASNTAATIAVALATGVLAPLWISLPIGALCIMRAVTDARARRASKKR